MEAFDKYFYAPLVAELKLNINTIQNSKKDELTRAIERGTVTFDRGAFSGRFNAGISRKLKEIGATWDKRKGVFRLDLGNLPAELRATVEASRSRFERTLQRLDAHLAKDLPAEIAEHVKTADLFNKSLWDVQEELETTLKNITIVPKLTESQADFISAEWGENMQLWVKNFSEEEIKKLRKAVQQNVFAGNRREQLVQLIKQSYGVTENKATFLARQESHLLLAKYKEARYTESGSTHYKWKCVAGSPLHPVRPSHKALDNLVFRWDDPPITTAPTETQRRNNPGEDYNCRCFAIPLFDYKGRVG